MAAAPNIASLTKYIAYPSVAHAGGQYLLAHDRVLQAFARLTNLAPDTPLNREAVELLTDEPEARLMKGIGPGGTGRYKLLTDLESAIAGSSIGLPIRRLFRSARAPWQVLAEADLIEFQWSEMMALAPAVRARFTNTPLVGIAHDVITQRWERSAESTPNKIARAAFAAAARKSRVRETSSFAALDLVLALSEKDAELVRAMSPGTRVEVLHPGLGPLEPVDRQVDSRHPIVLFTGALNRPDNHRGIAWFIEKMWPAVATAVPEAQLVIAGANPPDSLTSLVSRAPRARLTGFVDSLEPYYAQASVFVAPLLTGAGVKFKTLDAMLRGVPIVSTTVGAEGIDAQHLFAAVTDQPAEFSEALISQLRSPDSARTIQAQAWADSVYGAEAFRNRLEALYAELLVKHA